MRIPENLSALLKKIKISKNKFKIEVNNIEHPESYYQPTKDIKKILLMFEQAIKMIKEKYQMYSCEELFKNKFGEELSEVDFIYQDRLEAYSRRNQVTIDQLKEFYSEIRPLREEVCKRTSEEVTLAKCFTRNKFGDDSTYILDQMAQYEMIYGNKTKAKMFKKMSDESKTRIKKEERNERINNKNCYSSCATLDNKMRVLQGMMAVIVQDINPNGKEREYQENWKRSFQLLSEELNKNGIDLNCEDNGVNNKAIGDGWAKICSQVKNEKCLTYYAKMSQEAEIASKAKENPKKVMTPIKSSNSEPERR